eukprot:comp10958_c0_seq1/m.5533 comp10958_c0_seq1/g.5533  ORF comp10958_c0_seq1/g.5533 comp10958_c0_seq1/m.5533 type:complete len:123 (-) comp10958_c0_seq1:104-472(-)
MFSLRAVVSRPQLNARQFATQTGRQQVLSLYRAMLKTAGQFDSYNYRTYAQRRVRDGFREHVQADAGSVGGLVQRAEMDLEVMKRQAAINRMYSPHERLVIEVGKGPKTQQMVRGEGTPYHA